MLRSFDGLAVRQLRTRRLRALLTALGIVLGVGMVFGVLLLVGTIRHTFDELVDAAWGKTDLIVTGRSNAGTLPSATLRKVETTPGVREASAVVLGTFARLDAHGRAVRGGAGRINVAGYDPARPAPYDFRYDAGRAVRSGPEIAVEHNWARQRGLRVGDELRLITPSGPARLRVVGIFGFKGGLAFGGEGLGGMPLDEARRIMQVPTGYTQVYVRARDRQAVAALRGRLRARLGSGVEVKTPQGFGEEIAKQLQALNVVLYFFSGIALFVGGFLILNSFNMTVLQRMREIGMLRTLGATRAMVLRTVLGEALALGVVGSALGLALGLGLAFGLVAMMQAFNVPVGSLQLSATAVAVAVPLGLLTTVIAALRPARRAARIEPIRAVLGGAHEHRRPPLRRLAAGVALLVPGLLFGGSFWFGGQNTGSAGAAVLGITATMAMFAGMSMAAPWLITPLVRALAVPLRRISPTGGRLASDATRSNAGRTAATAVALTIGLSVVVVNGAMAGSFLGTISDQIDASYARDFTVQPLGQSLLSPGGQVVPGSTVRRIAALPQAAVATPLRTTYIRLPGTPAGAQLGLVEGVDPVAFGRVDQTPVAGATRPQALRDVAAGGVLVSRSYQRVAKLHVGSTIVLRGPGGTRRARVAGVLNAMSEFPGDLMQLSLATMRAVYGPGDAAQLLVKARSDADRAALERSARALLAHDYPNLELLSTVEVKQQTEDAINRQFAMFNAIVAIAIIVSLLGVVNTLAMSVIERTREIGVLRAIGSSRWQVRLTMLDESLLITLSGAIVGIALGALIGWTWVQGLDGILPGIAFRFPTTTAIVVGLAAVALGVVAAILPARRAARLKVIEALNYE